MIIAGIDYSLLGSGVVKLFLDDDFKIKDVDYFGFATTKKESRKSDKLEFLPDKKKFVSDMERYDFISNHITNFVSDCDYIAFEGYSYNSKGKIFNIAEGCGILKYNIFKANPDKRMLRIYTPKEIKKVFADNGNAGKMKMEDVFNSYEEMKPDISILEKEHPKEDIIDAFACVYVLNLELKVRHGYEELKNLKMKQIEFFNKVSRERPTNILSTPFE